MAAPAADLVCLLAPAIWSPNQVKAIFTTAVVTVCLLGHGQRYRRRLQVSFLDDVPAVLGRALTATAAVATVYALRHIGTDPDAYLRASIFGITLMLGVRCLLSSTRLSLRQRRRIVHPTLIVGCGPIAEELAKILLRCPKYGLLPVGYVDNESGPRQQRSPVPRLGSLESVDIVVPSSRIDVLLVADGDFQESELFDLTSNPACQNTELFIVPRLHEFFTQVGVPDQIGAIPVMRLRTPSLRGPAWKVKRAFDLLLASVAIVVLLPLFAVVALAVRWEGGPGVLFRQQRVGQDGRLFEVLKFRSLKPYDEEEASTLWSIASNSRMGPVGHFLRKTSIDELPQLWNILRGEMTLVGPRPERPHFVKEFSATHPRYRHRHRVPSGLTGLAQVSGLRGDTPIADRARYDNYYIENWSLWLDVKVILRTIREVVGARGA